MTIFATSQEWLTQSSQLLKAYPTTTKITTKYNIPNPAKVKSTRKRKTDEGEGDAAAAATSTANTSPATLEVRTYDPVSGVVLKYRTNKQQEVGRLIASLGRLGRQMAALPEIAEDVTMPDVAKEEPIRAQTPIPEVKSTAVDSKAGGAGAGKKKKKGKK